ncbi:2-C-methyl-D-erythritol 4-phosphate cytidylyltransferase [Enterococcus sp. BWT-B8]|uniref:IspD/TarI family cytidylyltransferase n=1 Tax=unclassified Enterococcus TaxID=2608891 RepID=UPI001E5FEF20|nr:MULTISPECIES: 2-C-methyl-D-erythritol 4-phosphate cytidylyltransferase [unclassified Enterococcus]MCB5952927.1 2-C-methyl-D-erythritol 4-phosphate cytidylyltransferase [Enterococcus sp. BWT-B8]MCB5953565.1 2-C-methyl-D-erythritol 4-phosphate cytidylyltransferase [Enterococcus sp. CWB-B31]
MYFAQIMAAGSGKRMGNTTMPKQFLLLGDKPIIIHTLEKFILNPDFEKIIISCSESWIQYTQDLIKKYIGSDDPRIVVIEGGEERNDTLNKAIEYIETEYTITDKDVLLIHDAVRPFITKRIISDNLAATENYTAVDTGIPAFDTIVQVRQDIISDIPNRDEMYQGQTPQTFNIKVLKRSYSLLTEEQKNILSDSCKICLLAGEKVKMVDGELFNIKITAPYDLKIANALLEEREND